MEFLFGWLVWKFFVHMFFSVIIVYLSFVLFIVLFLTCMRVVHVQVLFWRAL